LFAFQNGPIVRAIEKSRKELHPDLFQEQQDRLKEIRRENKEDFKKEAKAKQHMKIEAQREKEARSYDRIMKEENMTKNTEIKASADATAAEEYEDDFF
jgi:hypothetical protein